MCIGVCCHWFVYSDRWIVMEGSSESGWLGSDGLRDLNSSSLLARNPRVSTASGDNTSRDIGFLSTRKGRGKVLWPDMNSYRTPAAEGGTAGEGGIVRMVDGCKDVGLRQWLDNPERKVDTLECLHIFAQIVGIVNRAHSEGLVLHNIRPSFFVISSFNRVSYIESSSYSECGSDSNAQTDEFKSSSYSQSGNQLGSHDSRFPSVSAANTERNSETTCLQSCPIQAMRASDGSCKEWKGDKKHLKQTLAMESSWYRSPEEFCGGSRSFSSCIYELGVLLFELFCTCGSLEEKNTTMMSLRHRVLPPHMLLNWPKQTSFCLWLLHPEPSSRPKMSELLNSEFLNEPRDDIEEREAAVEIREKIEEQELLLEFLLLLQQRKQDAADSLKESIAFIASDIEEVTNIHTVLSVSEGSNIDMNRNSASHMNTAEDDNSGSSGSRKRSRKGLYVSHKDERKDRSIHHHQSEMPITNPSSGLSKNPRLMKNFRKFESAYFLTRRRAVKPTNEILARPSPICSGGRGSIGTTARSSISNPSLKERSNGLKRSGWVNTFLEGLSKYLSFSKLEVKANLKQGDLLNSSNLVCSLGFDRNGEFFATAGVNKKIKVFEYNSILSEDRDIHYPVVEMSGRSKLSSICWNGYIKSQIASSNFDGIVQVWDVSRGQAFMEMKEHERRVWSIDFSVADPTMLASGSDDGSVKLWNINQGVSFGTIKTKANVCCVQFLSDSSHSLAFGSADHKIYYYDLRNSKTPLCTLVGHTKTVSYVKFIDSTTLVSASTDNTLKLWDLSMCSSTVLDCPLQSFTGHLNVKNFVGLSVSEGYIATGSETNEVFVYHKAFPMPALSFKFNSADPVSGDEVDGSAAQFISSVCWRGHGQTPALIAANSLGNIKVLEMA